MQLFPYRPETDPKQYLAQALQRGVSGVLAHRQRKQFQKGLSPTMTPMQLFQKALQSGYPVREALGFTTEMARAKYYNQGGFSGRKRERPKRYDIKTLNDTLWKYTDGGTKDPSRNDEMTLRKMAAQSGYKLRKIPGKKKKLLGIDWLRKDEKDEWILQDAQGNPMQPEEPVEIPFESSAKAQSAPDMRLDAHWDNLSMEQREAIWGQEDKVIAALDNGYTVEEVLDALE